MQQLDVSKVNIKKLKLKLQYINVWLYLNTVCA